MSCGWWRVESERVLVGLSSNFLQTNFLFLSDVPLFRLQTVESLREVVHQTFKLDLALALKNSDDVTHVMYLRFECVYSCLTCSDWLSKPDEGDDDKSFTMFFVSLASWLV